MSHKQSRHLNMICQDRNVNCCIQSCRDGDYNFEGKLSFVNLAKSKGTAPLTLELISHDLQQTISIGEQLGKLLSPGDVICLSGDLGAGKTALTSGIAKGWGALEPVNSPTFVFIHEHQRAGDDSRLFHVDCYRLGSEEAAMSIGLEDILAGKDWGVVVWPGRSEGCVPV